VEQAICHRTIPGGRGNSFDKEKGSNKKVILLAYPIVKLRLFSKPKERMPAPNFLVIDPVTPGK
jgi:hypothetical protein